MKTVSQPVSVKTYLTRRYAWITAVFLLLFMCLVWHANRLALHSRHLALIDAAAGYSARLDAALTGLSATILSLAQDNRFGNPVAITTAISNATRTSVRLVNQDGIVVAGPPAPLSGIELDALQEAMRVRKPVVTDVVQSAQPARSFVMIVPLEEMPGGIVAAAAMPDRAWLTQALAPSATASVVLRGIYDRTGHAVLGQPNVQGATELPILDPRDNRPSGEIKALGQGVSGAFGRSALSGFLVVTAAAAPSSWWFSDIGAMLLTSAVFLGLGRLVMGRSIHHVVRSLRAAGDASGHPAPSGLREIDEVAGQIQQLRTGHMAGDESLRDMVATLDLAAVMARDFNGVIRLWSGGCERLYGWTAEQAVGQNVHSLLRTQFPRPPQEIETIVRDEGSWTGDLVHFHRDGQRVVVAVQKVLRRRQPAHPDLIMESLVDVTALRDAEDRLRQVNADLEQTVRDEIAARESAQRRAAQNDRVQALVQLAGGIAHDFNNILQAVAGSAALIERHPGKTDMVARFVGIIIDAAARGASITRRMLLLARRGDLKAEPVNVEDLLREMQDVFSLTLGAHIRAEIEVAPDLPLLLADKAQLETALVNLATNARDAMPDGGVLHMTATQDEIKPDAASTSLPVPGSYIRLSVSDEGTGMGPEVLARVGEPFFTTKGVGKGTGLGLSMVKGFSEQSGGGFAIESKLGEGTTASLWLPVATASGSGMTAASPSILGDLTHILVVDDDPLVRDTVTEQLQDLGHSVLSASGGTDALQILRARQKINLMITDLSMPGMDGISLIEQARALQPGLPAILLTGYASEAAALRPRGRPRPTYTLIRKPATVAILKARIGELLSAE